MNISDQNIRKNQRIFVPIASSNIWGLPCCSGLPLVCMPSLIPRRNRWMLLSLASPAMKAFPESTVGRLSHQAFRGLLGVHSRYRLHTRQVTQGDLLHQGLSPFCYQKRLPRLLPAGATVAGVEIEIRRAHPKWGVTMTTFFDEYGFLIPSQGHGS